MELTERGYEFGGVSVSELAKSYGTPIVCLQFRCNCK